MDHIKKNSVLTALILFTLFILGCQPVVQPIEPAAPASEGNRNIDLFDTLSFVDVITEDVVYFEGTKGYLAKPNKEGTYPGIIMIHEWWGLNDNIKNMARLLANEGYVVIAVDLYNGEVASDSAKAGQLAGTVRNDSATAVKNMRGAAAYLRNLPDVNDEKIASLGWCFGGGQSLQLALSDEKLAATVIYYGQLTDDKESLSKISWPVLGVFGETDTSIPVSSVNNFKSAINDLGIKNEIYIYPGVGHAFANPSGMNYAAKETLDAWGKTVKFLSENLKS